MRYFGFFLGHCEANAFSAFGASPMMALRYDHSAFKDNSDFPYATTISLNKRVLRNDIEHPYKSMRRVNGKWRRLACKNYNGAPKMPTTSYAPNAIENICKRYGVAKFIWIALNSQGNNERVYLMYNFVDQRVRPNGLVDFFQKPTNFSATKVVRRKYHFS